MAYIEREGISNPTETDRRLTVLNEVMRSKLIGRFELEELLDNSCSGEQFIALLGRVVFGDYGDFNVGILYGSRAATIQEALEKAVTFCQKLNQDQEALRIAKYYRYYPEAIAGLKTESFCLSREEILTRPRVERVE